MAYNVNYSDVDTKTAIRVEDNTRNVDTSLVFPGRNSTDYGRIVAENFLHLLENFASPNAPINPVEGQLWYDSSNGTLKIYDNVSWKAASSIQKSPTAPSVSADKVGEIWVDTVKQQLYVWSGAAWVLVGPEFSTESGLRTGSVIETINDSDNNARRVVKFLVEDVPVAIISKDAFTPKTTIPGFDFIRAGVNISQPNDAAEIAAFEGGTPVVNGVASSADGLNINSIFVPAATFLRTDQPNTTEFGLTIRNNAGLVLGADSQFKIINTSTAAKIYNGSDGSSLDLDIKRDGAQYTTIRIIGDKVGINVESPQYQLDLDGTARITSNVIITGTDPAVNFEAGSFRTAGGVAVSKNLLVGTDLQVNGTILSNNIAPSVTLASSLGSTNKKYKEVYAETIKADFLQGVLDGDIAGNARTATNLRQISSFQILGDIESNIVTFDGAVGGFTKQFTTQLTSEIINTKPEPFPNVSTENDFILTFREGAGLLKQSRDVFVYDLAVPIGAILPYAGLNVPTGYLLCDGSEVEKAKFSRLFDVLGNTYGVPTRGVNTFVLPDLRGRFPLGKDAMDNGQTVPAISGRPVDSGGGAAGRVPGSGAANLGGSGGAPSTTLTLGNLPEHEHTLRPPGSDRQFNVVRVDSAVVSGVAPGPGLGPTAPAQAQYLNSSGGIKTSVSLAQPVATLNPFLTLNYIIRSGPPAF